MNIFDQIKSEADRIVARDGTWACTTPLCILYADALEEMFTRIEAVREGIDPDVVITLLEPMKDR